MELRIKSDKGKNGEENNIVREVNNPNVNAWTQRPRLKSHRFFLKTCAAGVVLATVVDPGA